ncbi:MAG: hypothetical protein ABR503_13045 [Chitinophagaceae bacterium]
MKNFFLIFIFSVSIQAKAQECANCGDRTAIAFHKIEWLGIQKPEDPVLLEQWEKLDILWPEIAYQFDKLNNKKCLYVRQVGKGTQNSDVAVFNYSIYGIVIQSASDYILKLWLQPSCSNKILAETEVRFQLYPVIDVDRITQQAAAQLGPLMNVIENFESNERDSKNNGLGGDLWGGSIMITMDNALVKGEETRVIMRVVDCDHTVLKNKQISTEGTSGGVFTPAKFNTNADGTAIVKFKMTTDKTAIVKAACETKNVWGCQDLYTGTAAVKGIEGVPLKVSINYEQNETKTVKRATLPGIKIKGGEDAEMTEMRHRTVLYHFPTTASLKDGYLVETGKDNGGSKTEYVTESGWFLYTKSVQNAEITAMVRDIEVLKAEEDGEEKIYDGNASLQHKSHVTFYKGDANNPAYFSWEVEYPASNKGIAVGVMMLVKGEEGVTWKVNKITDPKSIYKTEYLLSQTIDAAEELKKGNKAMKDLLGVDLDGLTKVIDPTNPQSNMAGASGKTTITVRILSPYAEK